MHDFGRNGSNVREETEKDLELCHVAVEKTLFASSALLSSLILHYSRRATLTLLGYLWRPWGIREGQKGTVVLKWKQVEWRRRVNIDNRCSTDDESSWVEKKKIHVNDEIKIGIKSTIDTNRIFIDIINIPLLTNWKKNLREYCK